MIWKTKEKDANGALTFWSDQQILRSDIVPTPEQHFFQESCGVGYNDKAKHKCIQAKCFSCMSSDCTGGGGKIVKSIQSYIGCNLCNRFFKDNNCYQQHKFGLKTRVCKLNYRCVTCDKNSTHREYEKEYVEGKNLSPSLEALHLDAHRCDKLRCATCKGIYPSDHIQIVKITFCRSWWYNRVAGKREICSYG